APMRKPANARCREIATASPSVPSAARVTAVPATVAGAASSRSGRTPVLLASCHRASRASGLRTRGPGRNRAAAGTAGTPGNLDGLGRALVFGRARSTDDVDMELQAPRGNPGRSEIRSSEESDRRQGRIVGRDRVAVVSDGAGRAGASPLA